MDNKDFNRDKLLNDILRETAAQKDAAAPRQSAPTAAENIRAGTTSRIGTGCAPAEPADCIPAGSTGISAGKRSAGAGQQHPDHPV